LDLAQTNGVPKVAWWALRCAPEPAPVPKLDRFAKSHRNLRCVYLRAHPHAYDFGSRPESAVYFAVQICFIG